jgi:hypothetical protein
MTGINIIILIVFVVLMSVGMGYYLTKDQPTLKSMEEKQPVVKPQKKLTVRQLTESAKELVKEIEKVSETPITEEQSKEMVKDLVEIATAAPKKKRKYYPKKKK